MQPTLETGDLVVAFRQDSYAVGDIVVYRVPAAEPGSGADIVHRVVGGRDRSGRYLMRGDNKDGVDYWRPTDDEILGKLQLHVPRAGHVLMFLKTTLGMALVAASAAFLLALALFARPDDEEPEVPIPTLR
jgi:signal peptidase